ncbi:MAG: hypothetical protein ACLQVJ_13235 [Syntrophobacteraceae bacterium]
MPGLEALANRYDVKPGPERSEGPAPNLGLNAQREPDHSVGAASQKIDRELEAFGHGPRVSSADPKRSEGAASQKRPRKGSATNWALTKDRARTRSIGLPVVTYGPDLNVVRVQRFTRFLSVSREPET